MNILAHRGYWNNQIEKNTPKALRTALEKGYGFESDVRDYCEKMVISHDIATPQSQDAEEIFQLLHEFKDQYCFAINIKADGLKHILKDFLNKYSISNYFLFDMSTPQMVEFCEMGFKFFTRQSEIETTPHMYEQSAGVWIDGFWQTDWITRELLNNHIKEGKDVCLVSPDLHGNENYKDFWQHILDFNIDLNKLILCTDHPDEAKEFFDGF